LVKKIINVRRPILQSKRAMQTQECEQIFITPISQVFRQSNKKVKKIT